MDHSAPMSLHVQVNVKCKPSLFAYPPAVTEESSAAVSKVPTAVLSTTVRARERAAKRRQDKDGKGGTAKGASGSRDAGVKTGGEGKKKASAGATGEDLEVWDVWKSECGTDCLCLKCQPMRSLSSHI